MFEAIEYQRQFIIPNALFAVLFFTFFLVASAVASPMVRDALQLVMVCRFSLA